MSMEILGICFIVDNKLIMNFIEDIRKTGQ